MNRELYYETAREQGALDRLKQKKLSKDNLQLILDFVNEYGTLKNLSANRKTKYYGTFGNIVVWYKKELRNPTEKDFIAVINYIRSLDKSESTKNEYVVLLKTFYKWFERKYRKELSESVRDAIDWLKDYSYKINHNKVEEAEPISDDELKRMLDAAWTDRDKAWLVMLTELGVRVGEMLNLKIVDIKPYEHGYMVDFKYSKTRKRKLPLIHGAPYLETYLESHPLRNDPNAYLFVSMNVTKEGVIKPLQYRALTKRLDEIVAKAKISRRIWNHLFRHTAATKKASLGWSEAQMCKWFGWKMGSREPATYIHKSGIDAVSLAEETAGIKKQEVKKDKTLEPITCKNCNSINEATRIYCKKCHMQLLTKSEEDVMTVDDYKQMVQALVAEMKGLKEEVGLMKNS